MTMTRRDLLGAVGLAPGLPPMYHAMATPGHAQTYIHQGRISLGRAPNEKACSGCRPPLPVRSVYEVAGLANPAWPVEIEGAAVRPAGN